MYDRIIILGALQLAHTCAMLIREHGKNAEVIDTNIEKSLFLEKICINSGIPYNHMPKETLTEYLYGISEKTLIISAFNMYLIPKKILNKYNISAINCHHAILPNHPGANGTSWAIYEQDKEAGITWHCVTPQIDGGNIIIIKKCELDDEITAFQLSRKQYKLACEGFSEILKDLLKERIKSIPQDMRKKGRYCYLQDIPNDGFLCLEWDFDKMSAFLRALDYSFTDKLKKPIFPKPKLKFDNGQMYIWEKYAIEKCVANREVRFDGQNIVISKNNGTICLIDISPI